MSNKIILNELKLHYQLFFTQFYRDFYFEYENVNNHAHS
jgi:hypothetical protein